MATRNFKMGGMATDTITDPIALHSVVNSNNLTTPFMRGVTPYQVTAGKTFYCTSLVISSNSYTAETPALKLGYADNNLGLNGNPASYTNPISVWGTISNSNQDGIMFYGSNTGIAGGPGGLNQWNDFFRNLIWPFAPAEKYMYLRTTNTSLVWSMFMVGYEA
jgi:hypothetical protein